MIGILLLISSMSLRNAYLPFTTIYDLTASRHSAIRQPETILEKRAMAFQSFLSDESTRQEFQQFRSIVNEFSKSVFSQENSNERSDNQNVSSLLEFSQQVLNRFDSIKDKRIKVVDFSPEMFKNVAIFARIHSTLHTIVLSGTSIHLDQTQIKAASTIVDSLEKLLYPFLVSRSIDELIKSYKGRGIVLTAGKQHFSFVLHLVTTLRYHLNCSLPIQFFYNGAKDLPGRYQTVLKEFSDLELADLGEYYKASGKMGYEMKPLSLIYSRFKEVVFIDADALFLQNPEVLFEFKTYKEAGTVYFHDRALVWGWLTSPSFSKSMIEFPSNRAQSSRIWRETETVHELESGVVVLNKGGPVMYALLTTAYLNLPPARDLVYEHVQGDKETFWMAHEALGIAYGFTPGYAGVVGYKEPSSVCGSVAHTDEESNLLWWQNGLLKSKGESEDVLEFEAYSLDLELGSHWNTGSPCCFVSSEPGREVFDLDYSKKQMIEAYKRSWQAVKKRVKALGK